MTKYREIIRLSSMGLGQRSIASSCQCSRNTVSNVLLCANQKGLSWPIPENVGDADLQHMLFPESYRQARENMKNLLTAKENTDRLLRYSTSAPEQENLRR